MAVSQDIPKKSDLEKLPIVGAKPVNEKEEKYLKEIVPYEFYNIEEPGVSIKFPYGSTRNMKNFTLFHGGTYHVPHHVARHLENCSTPIWDYRPDGQGRMTKQRVGEKPRYQMRQKFSE